MITKGEKEIYREEYLSQIVREAYLIWKKESRKVIYKTLAVQIAFLQHLCLESYKNLCHDPIFEASKIRTVIKKTKAKTIKKKLRER